MKTKCLWRYLILLRRLRDSNTSLYDSYIRPRLVMRSAKWANCRIPHVTSYGVRNTNFVEALHHALKRGSLDKRISLWQAIMRVRSAFDHILANRQVRYIQEFRCHSTVDNHEELNELCERIVPRGVALLKDHLANTAELVHHLNGASYDVTESDTDSVSRHYQVQSTSWTCNCPFHKEFLMPCRHLLHVYATEGRNIGKYTISFMTII